MADVSHELGALRFVVDSPLSSKVAMFNNQATQHKQSQLLNPFSEVGGRASSPKPTFSKDQYGKPLAGSLTEMRGQKANMHVMKEMLELCQIIDSEGYQVKDEPTMRVIPFGELFNIYNYISDKVVGILLRARKHKLLEFEGEMLFQRRDDDVPIFLLKPIVEIRHELEAKIEEIKRASSPAPQSTSVLLDRTAHEQRLRVQDDQQRRSKSRSPSPAVKSKSSSPVSTDKKPTSSTETVVAAAEPVAVISEAAAPVEQQPNVKTDASPTETEAPTETAKSAVAAELETVPTAAATVEVAAEAAVAAADVAEAVVPAAVTPGAGNADLPTIVIEATAEFVRRISVDNTVTADSGAAADAPTANTA